MPSIKIFGYNILQCLPSKLLGYNILQCLPSKFLGTTSCNAFYQNFWGTTSCNAFHQNFWGTTSCPFLQCFLTTLSVHRIFSYNAFHQYFQSQNVMLLATPGQECLSSILFKAKMSCCRLHLDKTL